ncbi:hypothetical protein KNV77_gp076 [Klebsiella phage vB_KpnP_P184]|uniref:Uncharacterized protein n=1 Tax=Klebsiella phage vB_KpnP_P184 TaxID=2806547 RepID=A0A898KA02_9CAUD|nr:hypothetical protein KNV77_gp076 [Klebsiella phage vB_KpnP_P184]QSJ03726.1 hypothetical protein [Klebsiella phage vB_KpnP_P184]
MHVVTDDMLSIGSAEDCYMAVAASLVETPSATTDNNSLITRLANPSKMSSKSIIF